MSAITISCSVQSREIITILPKKELPKGAITKIIFEKKITNKINIEAYGTKWRNLSRSWTKHFHIDIDKLTSKSRTQPITFIT